jgi:hypothetical protein
MPGTTNFPTSLDTELELDATSLENDTGIFHDVVHNDHSAAIVALQTKVGADGSADTDSHDYKIEQLRGQVFKQYVAYEDLAAFDVVSIFYSLVASAYRVGKADPATVGEPHGIVLASVTTGNVATVYPSGTLVTGMSGLSATSVYYLDETTPGAITTTPGSWRIGVALRASALFLDIHYLDGAGSGSSELGITTDSTTAYTLVLGDAQNEVRMTNALANTVTVPPNSSVAFPVGSYIYVVQAGDGRTQLVAGSGVTINAAWGTYIGRKFERIMLVKVGTDEWDAHGFLTDMTITGSAPDDVEGTTYTGWTYTISGGLGTKTSTHASGTLPTGVAYNGTTHTLDTGSLSADGTFNYRITATDERGAQAPMDDTVVISNAPIYAVWDSSKLQTGNTLSFGDRTLTGGSTQQYSIATVGKSSGKWAFRVGAGGASLNTDSGGSGYMVGLCGSPLTGGAWPNSNSYLGNGGSGATEQIGYWENSTIYRRLSGGSGDGSAVTTAYDPDNDVIEFLVDLDAGTPTCRIRKQTNATGSFVDVATYNLPTGKTWYPAYTIWSSGNKITIDAGQSGFTASVGGYTDGWYS